MTAGFRDSGFVQQFEGFRLKNAHAGDDPSQHLPAHLNATDGASFRMCAVHDEMDGGIWLPDRKSHRRPVRCGLKPIPTNEDVKRAPAKSLLKPQVEPVKPTPYARAHGRSGQPCPAGGVVSVQPTAPPLFPEHCGSFPEEKIISTQIPATLVPSRA